MKKQPVTFCPLCEVECRGEGFIASPLKGTPLVVPIKQCPECMRLVLMSDDRYSDAKELAFLAKINGESEERTA